MITTPIDSPSDAQLLRQFVDSRSPQAFAALVDRHLPLIYSSALRQTRDPHLAEDIAQATLIIFSQRAARIDPPILIGWLLKTTHFVARNALRQQFRRARYEQRAAAMKSETQPPSESTDEISKLIDPALAKLRDVDRTAVVLRYFQNKSFADIAVSLNTTEVAVQKKIFRAAVLKLREILAGQGITVAPAALPALIASQKLHPVPSSLSLHAATMASTKSASTSFLVKGALKTMAAATKLKISIATIVAILLVGASVPAVYYYTHQPSQVQQSQSSTQPTASAAWLPKGTDLSKPVSGSLPPGMVAEPIGIMRLADGRWMTPTGDPLTNLPTELNTHLAQLKVKGATHAFLFRIKSQIAKDRRSVPQVDPLLQGVRKEGMAGWDDLPTSDQTQMLYQLRVIEPKPGAGSITLSIGVADGPYTNIGIIPASATVPVESVVPGLPATLFPPTEDQPVVHVKCDESNLPRDQEIYFYGVPLNGDEIDGWSTLTGASNTSYDFPGKLADFKEFRLDVRPINYHAIYAPVPLIR